MTTASVKSANKTNPRFRISVKILAMLLGVIAACRIVSTYHVFTYTFDEPAHLACGMEWLDQGKYLCSLEHPPLARVASALGPFLAGFRLSQAHRDYFDALEQRNIIVEEPQKIWQLGKEILHAEGKYFNNLSLARLGTLPFFLLTLWVTWAWCRAVFGDTVALCTISLLSTLPPLLGHAGLVTADMAAAGLSLSAIFAFAWWLELRSWPRSLLLGATCGLAVLAKFSALLFLPSFAVAILVWRSFFHTQADQVFLGRQRVTLWGRLGRLGLVGCTAFVVVWAGYHFTISSLTTSDIRARQAIDRMVGAEGTLHNWVYTTAEAPIFPMRAFFYGIGMVKHHNDSAHPTYLWGEYSDSGWWYFFPVVWAIKTPLGFVLLVGIGCVALVALTVRLKIWQPFLPFVCAVTIVLVSLPSRINLGIRHILLVYPLLAIVAGYGIFYLWTRRKAYWLTRTAAVVLLGWHFVSTSLAHPDYLAYFNEVALPSPERWRVDSDLDWGQDLQRLSVELRQRKVPELALAYFGSADPMLFDLPPFRHLERYTPTTGWIAISVTILKDVYARPPHDGYAWLEAYKPVAIVGKSIQLFYIPETNQK